MLSDSLVGGVLRMLATAAMSHSDQPKALELGTFTGYATTWLLDALPTNGQLISCELKQEYADIALRHLATHPKRAQLQLCVGPALDTLQSMVDAGESTTLDFIYLDANKKSYLAYYEFILRHRLLRRGGVLLIDNTLWKGLVTTTPQDSMTRSIDAFNQHLAQDTRVIATMLPIRDGLTIVQWKP